MKRGQQDESGQPRRRRRARRPLAAHPLFVAVLALWGAALGALVTLVLPREVVLVTAAKAGLGMLGAAAPFALAGVAAAVLGGAMLALGKALRPRRREHEAGRSLAARALAAHQVRTIDPASELGSASLDEPVETAPFAKLQPETLAPAPALEQPAPPVALDLAQFAALPGRNAVWVEGPLAAAPAPAAEAPAQAAPRPEPVLVRTAPRPANSSAVERLRAVPTSELSLVQMVERFAAALHEHQSAPAGRAGSRADQAARDAALAEALKALATFSHEEGIAPQSEPLRAAIARLQELRGAA